jgi:hypothetical protein
VECKCQALDFFPRIPSMHLSTKITPLKLIATGLFERRMG